MREMVEVVVVILDAVRQPITMRRIWSQVLTYTGAGVTPAVTRVVVGTP